MTHPQTIRLGKTEYVILPKAECLRLQSLAGVPSAARTRLVAGVRSWGRG